MPVIAERILNPVDQDRNDLQRLYGDDPAWLEQVLAGDGLLIGGRFNGRLLAAFHLDDNWKLTHLQVLPVTRRRGVARQLLELGLRQLPEEVRSVSANLSAHPELVPLFSELGFAVADGGGMEWTRPA